VQEVEDNMGALAWALSYTDREEIEAVFAKHDIETSPDIWIDQP
jgi:aryl-alcohol dehydrogenase-like predicted oxidoreductase